MPEIILTAPLIIGPRLTPALRVGDGIVSLSATEREADGRIRYRWWIDLPGGVKATDNDIRSGWGDGPDYPRTFGALLAFLGAFAEADEGDENFDLFPPQIREWAEANADEIGMLAYEIENPEEGK